MLPVAAAGGNNHVSLRTPGDGDSGTSSGCDRSGAPRGGGAAAAGAHAVLAEPEAIAIEKSASRANSEASKREQAQGVVGGGGMVEAQLSATFSYDSICILKCVAFGVYEL